MDVLWRMWIFLLLRNFHCDAVVPCSPNCIDMEFDGNGICTRGCIEGYWGNKCLNECPSSCSRRVCNRTNGLCSSCKEGYYGQRCEKECYLFIRCYKRTCAQDSGYCRMGCVPGYYGIFCDNSCGNCSSDTCDKSNGHCGTCNKGFYGEKCDMKCSNTCFNQECRKINGHCSNGCYRGFYGSSCEAPCSRNCAKIECLQSGVCIGGCKPNWSGEKCDRCEFGHYGPDCSKLCSVNCKRRTCDDVTGSCTYGCINGFYSDKCEKSCSLSCPSTFNRNSEEYEGECPVGKYGTYCNKTCKYNCKMGCSKFSGLCDFGCITGKFGVDCLQNCADGCLSGCLQEDGSCACKLGWQGQKCDECSQTHYGPQCDQLCSPMCLNRICFSNNGSCMREIQSNLTDDKPFSEINEKLENCSTALYEVIATLFISIIVNIVLILRTIRQNFSHKEKQETRRQNSIRYANTAMYAEVEVNAGYPEVGQLSQPSHYDELK
ncbi:platelet endothelial aggregation receptor 1-like [Saccostrea cucullata]|uniref:platelet endothelial aggregation receptor 1-like n=1 Tax=Saccostrea cuccullata TaxID=36930 RepID=UPI002ED59FC3